MISHHLIMGYWIVGVKLMNSQNFPSIIEISFKMSVDVKRTWIWSRFMVIIIDRFFVYFVSLLNLLCDCPTKRRMIRSDVQEDFLDISIISFSLSSDHICFSFSFSTKKVSRDMTNSRCMFILVVYQFPKWKIFKIYF